MTISLSVRKPRGQVGKEAAYEGVIKDSMEAAKTKYTKNAKDAVNRYKTGLQEYINWYYPQIESFANQARVNDPDYYEKSEAGQNARIDNAVETARQTAKLAAMWRKLTGPRNSTNATLNSTGGYPYPGYTPTSKEKVIKL